MAFLLFLIASLLTLLVHWISMYDEDEFYNKIHNGKSVWLVILSYSGMALVWPISLYALYLDIKKENTGK
jgi:hypothetical protein